MSKVELLCPAGNYQAFEAALYHGADAIFLAGPQYGARANADNFTLDEMKEAVKLAHLYGVKIHVTLNTLIHDSEFEACKAYIAQLDEIGVDAVIVQDLGILNLLSHEFANLKIHASTQMHIHNLHGIEQAKKWNLQRCVVARESSLQLIKKMCQMDMEIEVFVQGAYCVSYSGECHMSRNIGGRSANRGECAQSCRLPYEIEMWDENQKKVIPTKGKYLLSLKDLNAIGLIVPLIECGVTSFKIEGRMKRPEYVACMCSIYRQAIDAYENHQKFDINQSVLEEMKKVFNRGFTEGYLTQKEGLEIMSTLRPNHQGIPIGKIIGFHHDRMKIQLNGELNQHDGIRIMNDKEDHGFIVNYMYKDGRLVSSAKNEVIELQKVKAKIGDLVMKTSDVKQLEALSNDQNKLRKIPVQISVSLKSNQPLKLIIKDGTHQAEIISEQKAQIAKTMALTIERIKKQLNKLGNTPFICNKMELDVDDQLSFSISEINECRRKAVQKLMDMRMYQKKASSEKKDYHFSPKTLTHELNVTILNENQYEIVQHYPVNIYIENEALYQKVKKNPRVFRNYPRVYHQDYNELGLIHDIGGIKDKMKASAYMNCMNAMSAAVLFEAGIDCVTLSHECNDNQIEELVKNYQHLSGMNGNFAVDVYGRSENMVLENCIIKSQLKLNRHCQQCHLHEYYLKDTKNQRYRLLGDDECRMKVYHFSTFNKIEKIEDYQKMGISNFGISLTFEKENEVKQLIEKALLMMKIDFSHNF